MSFLPKEKMSKKARKALASRKRKTWAFSPTTKTIESGKKYDRSKARREVDGEPYFYFTMPGAPYT